MNRIKYWLLRILLGDICEKTDDCYNCRFRKKGKYEDSCTQGNAYGQARKVWGLENENL